MSKLTIIYIFFKQTSVSSGDNVIIDIKLTEEIHELIKFIISEPHY